MSGSPRFRSVVFDFDSTLSSLEGVEWIAARVGPEVAAAIAEEVTAAMSGRIALEEVYAGRLARLHPTAADLAALGAAYADRVAPDAAPVLARLRDAGVQLRVVSGGFREAILPAARVLGFADDEVAAVSIFTAPDGSYVGYDAASPLITQLGKGAVIEQFRLPRPSLMVGDGATDAAARSSVDAFAAFVGFARRESVVAVADHVVGDYAAVEALVLG